MPHWERRARLTSNLKHISINSAKVLESLQKARMQFSIDFHEVVDSTNLEIRRLVGAKEGAIVCALQQTGGYGRQGRAWQSPLGGLYFSMLLNPASHGVRQENFPQISCVAALAMQKCLSRFACDNLDEVSIKWPNDILLGPNKIAGISLEVFNGLICMGCGINVSRPKIQEPIAGKYSPAYLHDHIDFSKTENKAKCDFTQVIEELLADFCHHFSALYSTWLLDGLENIIEEYNKHSYLINRQIILESINGKQLAQGLVCGVDSSGAIMLKTASKLSAHHAGEAHVVGIE